MTFKGTVAASTFLGLLALSMETAAHTPSRQECLEGGHFIKNAAISRDNGMDSMTFTTKMLADFVVIRSFPEELRWFVQDKQDEDLLLTAVTNVFQNPVDPEAHEHDFFQECTTVITVHGR